MRVAILGLGEAGSRYAADLAAAGWRVTGYDPAPTKTPSGVRRVPSIRDAVAEAELVVSLTGSRFAVDAAAETAGALPAGACYADFNTTAPSVKRAVADRIGGPNVADVAVLAPVPRRGCATPLLASGDGAATVADAFRSAGAQVDVLAEPVGAAAGRKLLRSVFMKGLAATVLEAVTAGAAAGCADWVREQIAAELGPDGPALVERLITGTNQHAARRLHEVQASRDHLTDLGVPTHICDATLQWLTALNRPTEPQGTVTTPSHNHPDNRFVPGTQRPR
jgi:3-hydroxyisobutyrate dehydrogenase-like beta-hydroxyacid dehydrogenase